MHWEDKQCYNVFNWEEDKSMIGAVAQCYQYNVFYWGEGNPSDRGMPLTLKETISHFCDTLEMEMNFGGIKGPKGIS